jgi:hypothetical protein
MFWADDKNPYTGHSCLYNRVDSNFFREMRHFNLYTLSLLKKLICVLIFFSLVRNLDLGVKLGPIAGKATCSCSTVIEVDNFVFVDISMIDI